jgi:hypothetical protein
MVAPGAAGGVTGPWAAAEKTIHGSAINDRNLRVIGIMTVSFSKRRGNREAEMHLSQTTVKLLKDSRFLPS